MKLDRTMSGACVAAAFALASMLSGCSATASTATGPAKSAGSARSALVAPNAVGTTNLMSAELSGPAPKVGKAHLAVDEDSDSASAGVGDDESSAQPKERRSDGSHRRGGFGSSK